jgi:tetratricopeptide (TPR) repeat protein
MTPRIRCRPQRTSCWSAFTAALLAAVGAATPAAAAPPAGGFDGRRLPELRAAYARFDAAEFADAGGLCEGILDKLGPTPAGDARPLFFAANLLLGDTWLLRNDLTYARRAYERVRAEAPVGSPAHVAALERLFEVARQWAVVGRKRRMETPVGGTFPLIRISAVGDGLRLLSDLRLTAPAELAVRSRMLEAEYYFSQGDFDFAEDQYTAVRKTPGTEFAATAELQAALCLVGKFRGTEYDLAVLGRARTGLEDFRKAHPEQARAHAVDLLIERIDWCYARRDFETGEFYRRLGDLRPAIKCYRYLIADPRHRGSPWVERARARLRELGAGE